MFDLLSKIQLPPYLLFILIIVGMGVYYFHKDISKLITRKWNKEDDIKDLKSHDIFNTLERVKQDVSHMKFYTHGVFDANKSRMCSDFAKFKCNVCTDAFVEFLDNDFSKEVIQKYNLIKCDSKMINLYIPCDNYFMTINEDKLNLENPPFPLRLFGY